MVAVSHGIANKAARPSVLSTQPGLDRPCLNRSDPMSHRTQPPNWHSSRGPWPEFTDINRLFDHGKSWCATAHGHPGPEDGYPDPDVHVPWNECRTPISSFTGARRDLNGALLELELYAAAAFQFGSLRSKALPSDTRVVLEAYADEPGQEPIRVSLSAGEALRLARRMTQLVDLVSGSLVIG
jgi:hypothetical protein